MKQTIEAIIGFLEANFSGVYPECAGDFDEQKCDIKCRYYYECNKQFTNTEVIKSIREIFQKERERDAQ